MENFGKQLNRLIHMCEQTHIKYLHAAEDTASVDLRNMLQQIAEKRLVMMNELKNEIAAHSTVEPGHGTDIIGSIHKVWTDIRTAVAGHSEKDILEICRSSDHEALESYDEILQGEILYSDLKPLLVKQRTAISQDYQQINKLYAERYTPAGKE